MKVLIFDLTNREYLAADGRRTASPNNAFDFEFTMSAYYQAQHDLLGEFQVVFYLPESDFVMNVIRGTGTAHALQTAA